MILMARRLPRRPSYRTCSFRALRLLAAACLLSAAALAPVTAIAQTAVPPHNITGTAGDTTIEISWDDGVQPVETTYTIKLTSSWGLSDKRTYTDATSPFTANCLNNGATYAVAVHRAGEDHGGRGPEVTPASTLTAATVDPHGDGVLRVSWDDDGTTSYAVRYKNQALSNPRDLWEAPQRDVTSAHDITGLDSMLQHAVQLGKVTDTSCPQDQQIGWSDSVLAIPFLPPTELRLTGRNAAIRADWTLGATQAKHLVEYRKETDSEWIRVEDDNGREIWNRYTIPNLENGTSYVVRAGARYNGTEQWSETLETMPFDPENYPPVFSGEASASVAEGHTGTVLTATATHKNNETITFKLKDNNGVVTKDGAQFSITTGGVLTFDSAPDFDDPLDRDRNNVYLVDIVATSGTGASTRAVEREYAITVTNVAELPGKPDAPTVRTAGDNELAVSWTAPTYTGPPISGYALRYGTDGTTWTELVVGLKTAHSLTGLRSGVDYQIGVRAMNADGDGPWSDSSTGTPEGAVRLDATLTVGAVGANFGYNEPNEGALSDTSFSFRNVDYTINWVYSLQGSSYKGISFKTTPVIPVADMEVLTLVFYEDGAPRVISDLVWNSNSQRWVLELDESLGFSLNEKVRMRIIFNNPPKFDLYDRVGEVDENLDTSQVAFTIKATDLDSADSVRYHFVVDPDDGLAAKDGELFHFDGATGELRFKSVPDRERPIDRAGSGSRDTSDACDGGTGECNSIYQLHVLATSGTGIRQRTSPVQAFQIQIHDVEEPPARMAPPTVRLAGNNQLAASWTAPVNTGPDLSRYSIRYGTDPDNPVAWRSFSLSTSPLPLSSNLNNTTNGTPYYVQVRATNDEGNGEWSDSTRATPRAGAGMTVKASGSSLGFTVIAATTYGSLSPKTFSHGGNSYTVTELRTASDQVYLVVSPGLPTSTSNLELIFDDQVYRLGTDLTSTNGTH